MPLPAAAHLVEFPLAPKGDREEEPASPATPACWEAETAVATDIEAAFARGREEGLAAGRQESAEKLDEERAAAAARLAEERAAWSSEEGARLAEMIATALQTLETNVGDAVAAILSPVLEDTLRTRAVEELAQTLTRLMASDQRILRITGPGDLLEALREQLGASATGIVFEGGEDIDVRVIAEQTTIETQLCAWMPRINGEGA